ncbi:hypothetical protein RHMOL_Rhmol10G0119400 [Rhododendron molle]|uniref:Uncharacterized protein n=2 Tax=Rhododendron molle TaxID=49168 RepID=A0ACC0M2C4_RHOML|nr:hypothetical protein RHMOL_Rhmol10G0119400 [Rhododendron molle]
MISGMDCVYPHPQFFASVFPHGKGKALTPKLGCPKSDRFASRNSLDSLKYCGSILKLQVEFRVPSLNTAPHHPLVVRCNHPQNADLPKHLSKKEKKPFPTPILELRRAAEEIFKNSRGKPKRPVPPPKNGLLVKSLIPLAYNVLNARTSLINNLKMLLKAVPVHA